MATKKVKKDEKKMIDDRIADLQDDDARGLLLTAVLTEAGEDTTSVEGSLKVQNITTFEVMNILLEQFGGMVDFADLARMQRKEKHSPMFAEISANDKGKSEIKKMLKELDDILGLK